MLALTLKPRRCKHCREKFAPERFGQIVHKDCIEGYMAKEIAKRQAKQRSEERRQQTLARAETRRQRQGLKDRSDWHADAQKAVNAMVRARDAGLPCISCGKPWQPDFQAGHYRSRGAAKHLALDPRNIHGQCVQCNLHKHSNAIDYRIRLAERCGIEHVEALEADNAARHYSIADLQAIRADFLLAAKNLKANT